jgi:hypothetical protein
MGRRRRRCGLIQMILARGISIHVDGQVPNPGWVVKIGDDSQSVLFFTVDSEKVSTAHRRYVAGPPRGIQSTDEGLIGAEPGVMIGDKRLMKIDLFAPIFDPDKAGYNNFWYSDEQRNVVAYWENGDGDGDGFAEYFYAIKRVVGDPNNSVKVAWDGPEESTHFFSERFDDGMLALSEVEGYVVLEPVEKMVRT